MGFMDPSECRNVNIYWISFLSIRSSSFRSSLFLFHWLARTIYCLAAKIGFRYVFKNGKNAGLQLQLPNGGLTAPNSYCRHRSRIYVMWVSVRERDDDRCDISR